MGVRLRLGLDKAPLLAIKRGFLILLFVASLVRLAAVEPSGNTQISKMGESHARKPWFAMVFSFKLPRFKDFDGQDFHPCA